MEGGMALSAQCDQVLFAILAQLASEFHVVYLQLKHAPACLAAPAITLQYPAM
jgi:hypothetical protein